MKRDELIAIPDLHFPWASQRALGWLYAEIERLQPRHVVQLGDLLDQYCFSRFARNPNLLTPQEELRRGVSQARQMWAQITRRVPGDCKLYQLAGNHDDRLFKRVAEQLPELQGLFETNFLDFPGVKTFKDGRDYLELKLPKAGPVILTHGWLGKAGAHMHYFNQSVIFGHLHRPSLVYEPRPSGSPHFELNCGYMGDPGAPVFDYSQTKRKKWQIGYGRIDASGTPSFVSYRGRP
jgi:hypothetical protein